MRRLAPSLLAWLIAVSAVRAAEWAPIDVPGALPEETRRAVDEAGGWGWYRAWVKPDDDIFKPHERNINEESVGITVAELVGAYELFLNGRSLGGGGAFPPGFQDSAGETRRLKVPVGSLRKGEWNEIAIRVYLPAAEKRGGFLGEAPFLMNYFRECVLKGKWQFRAGRAHEPGMSVADRPPNAAFDSFRDSNRVLGRTEQVHGPSLAAPESWAKLRPGEPFAVDLLLHEPLIAQPFYVSFDERGRMWVAQSRQYPYPAGLRMLSRDQYYRAHYDKVPPAPPGHDRGADIISVHESTRRDGVYDKHSVFLEGLNMANAALRGRGGVWVMHTPYLLFYPDADGDDVPDGPPQVRLAGFGLEDSHAIANGLTWGPDGWLYGMQGSTSSCTVVRPGDDPPGAKGVAFTACMVWRYHPDSRAFEIFAEGGGNNFGLEFDTEGRLFGGYNGADTRGFHFVQGGVYLMQYQATGKYGPPRNPFAYGVLPPLASDDTIVRFTHNLAFADGTAMPAATRGHMFALDPLHSLVTDTSRLPRGSSFETKDGPVAVGSEDVAFRPVYVTNAPDGALCICDMYDFYVAHGQHYQNQIDPTTGRIYRLRGREAQLEHDTDLSRRSTAELVGLLAHPNKWHRQTAVRLLGERKDPAAKPLLAPLIAGSDGVAALHALWAWHQAIGLDEASALAALASSHAAVRTWTVRLLGDGWGVQPGPGAGGHAAALGRAAGLLPESLYRRVLEAARSDDDAEVACQILATARRLAPAQALPLVDAVVRRDRFADDPFIPLMAWWVLEANIPRATESIVAAFSDPTVWRSRVVGVTIVPRLARRLASEEKRPLLLACARLFRAAPTAADAKRLFEGFDEAFRGRSIAGLPEELLAAIEAAGEPPLAFRLRRKNPQAVAEALARLRDPATAEAERLALVRTLGELRLPETAPVLQAIAGIGTPAAAGADGTPAALRAAALAALAALDIPALGDDVARAVPRLDGQVRTAAFALLASRAAWAGRLLDAVESGAVASATIPDDVADRLRGHKDPAVRARAIALVPATAAAPPSTRERVERIQAILASGPGNPYAGEATFVAKCSQCHKLFHKGGNVGPELTNYQRDNLGTMLQSIVDPSAEIREGYQYHVIETADGRSLSGFIVDRDDQATVLRTLDGETISLNAADIETFEPMGKSIMPAGLLDGLVDEQLRDFFAYLRIKQPISK